MAQYIYEHFGFCPICETQQWFRAEHEWYRDMLFCDGCQSVPRERALALVLNRRVPDWRARNIHECSPVPRGISLKMKNECPGYVATQFVPDQPLGMQIDDFRNENLEHSTFEDESFDLVMSLDVMEHVNEPQACFVDIVRTLRPEGLCIFTAPTEKNRVQSERVARYLGDGTEVHYAPPEYHGNPVDSKGALVTFKYGYEFTKDIASYAPLDVTVYRFCDHHHGIIGEYTEVYECRKSSRTQA